MPTRNILQPLLHNWFKGIVKIGDDVEKWILIEQINAFYLICLNLEPTQFKQI